MEKLRVQLANSLFKEQRERPWYRTCPKESTRLALC